MHQIGLSVCNSIKGDRGIQSIGIEKGKPFQLALFNSGQVVNGWRYSTEWGVVESQSDLDSDTAGPTAATIST